MLCQRSYIMTSRLPWDFCPEFHDCHLTSVIKLLDLPGATMPEMKRAMKPLFIKRLPPQVQMVTGQSLVTTCKMMSEGCRPRFIKQLPSNMEVCRGNNVEVRCEDHVTTERNIGRMQGSLEMEASR